ncbi:unnamed protein product [Protopolystoma xenopodis]|uniref:Uncharacterized protein n=1 Tax=Protopolystoma xenopodis TaxID=117903 RepID=A0A448X3L5_9PLAT|nr:unnamed protein product [Protopolystoma xenopodis]
MAAITQSIISGKGKIRVDTMSTRNNLSALALLSRLILFGQHFLTHTRPSHPLSIPGVVVLASLFTGTTHVKPSITLPVPFG